MDMGTHVDMKQRKSSLDGQRVYYNNNKQFLGSDHIARQAAEAGKNLIMMMKRKERIGTSMLHSTRNSIQY